MSHFVLFVFLSSSSRWPFWFWNDEYRLVWILMNKPCLGWGHQLLLHRWTLGLRSYHAQRWSVQRLVIATRGFCKPRFQVRLRIDRTAWPLGNTSFSRHLGARSSPSWMFTKVVQFVESKKSHEMAYDFRIFEVNLSIFRLRTIALSKIRLCWWSIPEKPSKGVAIQKSIFLYFLYEDSPRGTFWEYSVVIHSDMIRSGLKQRKSSFWHSRIPGGSKFEYEHST